MTRAPWRENMFNQGRWKGPILDQHMHLDRNNRYLSAVSEFVNSGGTAINLVHKPNFSDLPSTISDELTLMIPIHQAWLPSIRKAISSCTNVEEITPEE